MPASDFIVWRAFFDIYPFTVERLELGLAKVAYMNSNGKGKLEDFMPNYLGKSQDEGKSVEQQDTDFEKFQAKLMKAKRGELV